MDKIEIVTMIYLNFLFDYLLHYFIFFSFHIFFISVKQSYLSLSVFPLIFIHFFSHFILQMKTV